MTVFTSINLDKHTSLNGLWDFRPCEPGDPMLVIPQNDWEEDVYLAPSSFRGPCAAAFGYPAHWGSGRNGWLRRFIRVERRSNRRAILQFDGVGPCATVFVNDTAVGETYDAYTPFEVDITDALNPHVNELVVRIMDVPRDENNRCRMAAGHNAFAGIWQDVRIVERSEIHASDIAIQTSQREGTIVAEVTLTNASRRPRTVTVHNDVVPWKASLRLATAEPVLTFADQTCEIPARGSISYRLEAPWPDAPLWSPENPQLHMLRLRISESGRALYVQGERFGFREIQTADGRLLLNGRPLRLFSCAAPEARLHQGTEQWIKRWLAHLRISNINHAHLTGGWGTRLLRDLADEEGLLLTLEGAINGAAEPLASHTTEFWTHSANHLRRLVLAERNRPSVIIWSPGNRLIDNLNLPSPAFRELPRILQGIRELDPTRLATLGDAGIHWPVAEQSLLRLSPGTLPQGAAATAAGIPWLVSAADKGLLADAESLEAAVAAARADAAVGVTIPSMIHQLDPLPAEDMQQEFADEDAPGLKFASIPAKSTCFDFWTPYRRRESLRSPVSEAAAALFRPLAIYDTTTEKPSVESPIIARKVTIVNDSPADFSGRLEVVFKLRDKAVASRTLPLSLAAGTRMVQSFSFDLPEDSAGLTARFDYSLHDASERRIELVRATVRLPRASDAAKAAKAAAAESPASTGFPVRLWIRNTATSSTVAENLLQATVRANTTQPSILAFAVADRWIDIQRPEGWVGAAASNLSSPIYIFSRFEADVVSSSLIIEGQGTAEVMVGGKLYSATLQEKEGGTRLDDIALEPGYNAMLIYWKPVDSESRIRCTWCDAAGAPRTSFRFS